MIPDTVIVLAKSPRPGLVKTRLQPTFTPHEAAALAAAAIRDTLDTVARVGPRRVVVAWDGPLVPWLPTDVEVVDQRGGGLDERLENVFADVLGPEGAGADRPTFLVGMDTPQLEPGHIDVEWRGADALLGPSCDGGFWAIGFRRYVPGAIRGVPMSTPRTGAAQRLQLRRLGLSVATLPTLRDVDEPADAAEVADVAPWTRFSRLHRRLVETPCSPTTLFDAALAGSHVSVQMDGVPDPAQRDVPLPAVLEAACWQQLNEADELLVARCEGPVLDIGCGPGRFVEALASRGLPALGVDVSRGAVERATARGASALLRDVHDRLPGEGRWGTVLLADGNIGIGGNPLALLHRCRALVRPGAVALVETCADERADCRTSITLHGPTGRRSTPVPWAVIGAHALVELAAKAGFVAVEDWRVGGRAFVMLRHAA